MKQPQRFSPSILLDWNHMIYTAYYTFASQLLLALHGIDFINVKAPLLLSFVLLLYSNLYIHSPGISLVHFNHFSSIWT